MSASVTAYRSPDADSVAALHKLVLDSLDDDQAVDPGGLGILQEAGHAVGVDRIVVAHQHHGRPRIARAEAAHEVEGAAHYLPAYAGNLDIMTSAALRTAESMADRVFGAVSALG